MRVKLRSSALRISDENLRLSSVSPQGLPGAASELALEI